MGNRDFNLTAPQSIARAYDAIASDYDAQLETSPLAREMRRQLHHHFTRLYHPGDRVLDFTAGTGIDACFLASIGVRVTALDISSEMIGRLNARASNLGLTIETHVLDVQDLAQINVSEFDGAISTFAGLNTIGDIPRLARTLSARLKPRAHVLIHALNRFCLWEALASFLYSRPHRASTKTFSVDGQSIPYTLFDPNELWRSAFTPSFRLRAVYGMSVIASPAMVIRFPRLTPVLLGVDRVMGRLFPAAGDFFVMELER